MAVFENKYYLVNECARYTRFIAQCMPLAVAKRFADSVISNRDE